MRKWRELFAVSQITLSEKMLLSASVISDYESGRRKSPGAKFIRRFVLGLLLIDEEKGSPFYPRVCEVDEFSEYGYCGSA